MHGIEFAIVFNSCVFYSWRIIESEHFFISSSKVGSSGSSGLGAGFVESSGTGDEYIEEQFEVICAPHAYGDAIWDRVPQEPTRTDISGVEH